MSKLSHYLDEVETVDAMKTTFGAEPLRETPVGVEADERMTAIIVGARDLARWNHERRAFSNYTVLIQWPGTDRARSRDFDLPDDIRAAIAWAGVIKEFPDCIVTLFAALWQGEARWFAIRTYRP